jgi:excisionase family DNA binding protein
MKDFFSVHEVAKLLKMSRSGVLYYINSGRLKAQQVGKIYIIFKEDLGDFLRTHKDKKKRDLINQTELDFDKGSRKK